MVTIYLRAASEAAIKAALPMFVDDAGSWSTTHLVAGVNSVETRCDLVLIGAVVEVPAVLDDDGHAVAPAVYDPRYHANLVCPAAFGAEVPAEIIIPAPASPSRVLA